MQLFKTDIAYFYCQTYAIKDKRKMKKHPVKKTSNVKKDHSRPSRRLSFRVWDVLDKKFVGPEESLHCFSTWVLDISSGEIIRFIGTPTESGECFFSIDTPLHATSKAKKSRYIVTQYAGFRDKHKKMVYEGDIIEFTYYVGDLAWQEMDESEAESQRAMVGKSFRGVVEREATSQNMQLTVNFKEGSAFFPVAYARGAKAKVVGNIFE